LEFSKSKKAMKRNIYMNNSNFHIFLIKILYLIIDILSRVTKLNMRKEHVKKIIEH
jgi:hypothetical protein